MNELNESYDLYSRRDLIEIICICQTEIDRLRKELCRLQEKLIES